MDDARETEWAFLAFHRAQLGAADFSPRNYVSEDTRSSRPLPFFASTGIEHFSRYAESQFEDHGPRSDKVAIGRFTF